MNVIAAAASGTLTRRTQSATSTIEIPRTMWRP